MGNIFQLGQCLFQCKNSLKKLGDLGLDGHGSRGRRHQILEARPSAENGVEIFPDLTELILQTNGLTLVLKIRDGFLGQDGVDGSGSADRLLQVFDQLIQMFVQLDSQLGTRSGLNSGS